MARVKRAVHAKKHHRAVLEQAQGYYGNKSRFIAGLRVAEVTVDRKVLADLAVHEPEAFASLVNVATEALAAEKTTEAAS
jgi:ribosomal protein L20